MKKLVALLLMLCMLTASIAFAEAPAVETEEVAANPQDALANMIDQAWYGFLTKFANNFNVGASVIDSVLTQASEALNTWIENADARYTASRSGIIDSAMRLLTSATEVAEDSRYVALGDDEAQAAAEEKVMNVYNTVQELVGSVTAEVMESTDAAQDRVLEAKDTMIDSATDAIGSAADLISDLIFIVTGTADSNAQSRGVVGSEEELPQVSEAANKVQFFLNSVMEYLGSLKDVEPDTDAATAL